MPNVFIKPLDIAVGIISVLGILRLMISKKLDVLYKDKIFKLVILFFLIGFISLLFNSRNLSLGEFLSSFLYGVRFVSYAFLLVIIKNIKHSLIDSTVYMLLTAGIVLLIFGFIQYLFYSDLRNLYYLGWDEHMHRMFSTFLDPNFSGGFFVLFLIFISAIGLYFFQINRIKISLIFVIFWLITLAAVYLTFSRSALIMLFVGAFVFLFLVKKLKWILVFIVSFLIFAAISSKSFYIENVNLLRTASTGARLESARIAVEIIKENPVLGVGFNSYKYAQIRYGFRDKESALKSHADAGTDNSFLFILATTGIAGFASYLYLLFTILKQAFKSYKTYREKNIEYYLAIIVITSFVGIIVNSMFINSLFYPPIMLWMWILVGLLDNTVKNPSLRSG